MKNTILVISACTSILFSCTTEPICECYETRLKIKELLRSADGNYTSVQSSDEYKELKKKKKDCKNKIEPQYFENNKIERKGRSDREFLMEELGESCEAVKKLYGDQ